MDIKHGYNRQIQEKSCAEQLREPTPSHPSARMVALKAVTDKRKALEMKAAELKANLKLKENEVRSLHCELVDVRSGFSCSGNNNQSESTFTLFAHGEGFGIGAGVNIFDSGSQHSAVVSSFDFGRRDESESALQSVRVKGFGHEPRPAVHFLDPTPARAPSPGVPLPQYASQEELSRFYCLNIRSAGSGGSKRSGEKLPFTNNHFNSEFLQVPPS